MKPKEGASPKPPVLLAEDDEHDVFFMRRAFVQAGVSHPLHIVHDGLEAIDYLQATGTYTERRRFPFPCLLITDLKMPRMDGLELLAWLQQRSEFNHLPRIMLSSSGHESDVGRAEKLGAHAYFWKPGEFRELVDLVQQLNRSYLASPGCQGD